VNELKRTKAFDIFLKVEIKENHVMTTYFFFPFFLLGFIRGRTGFYIFNVLRRPTLTIGRNEND
jgi:hypothetical protein